MVRVSSLISILLRSERNAEPLNRFVLKCRHHHLQITQLDTPPWLTTSHYVCASGHPAVCWPFNGVTSKHISSSAPTSYSWAPYLSTKCFFSYAKVDISHFHVCLKCGKRLCLQLYILIQRVSRCRDVCSREEKCHVSHKTPRTRWPRAEILNSRRNEEQTRWQAAHRAGGRSRCYTEHPLRDPHLFLCSCHMAACSVEALIQTLWQVHVAWPSHFEAYAAKTFIKFFIHFQILFFRQSVRTDLQ